MASDGKWYSPEQWTGPPRDGIPAAVGAGAMPQFPGSAPGSPTYPVYQSMPAQGGYVQYAAPKNTNGMAIASLVCSCVGIIPFLFGVPCILGIIFGFVGRNQIRQSQGHQQGSGLALAGIIVGFSLIGLFLLFIILAAAIGHTTACFGSGQFCGN
jgi:hypothetical protein